MAGTTPAYEYTPKQIELLQVYDLYRDALLNAYYYARREKTLSRWNLSLQIISTIGSAITLAGLLAKVPQSWLIFSGLAAVCVVILPLFHLTEKIAEFQRLYFAYNGIYHSLDSIIKDIDASKALKDWHRIKICSLRDQYKSLGPLYEIHFDRDLRDKIQEEVNQIIPADRLWLPYDDE